MTWEELFTALEQVRKSDEKLMQKKVAAVYSGDESILLDLMVSVGGKSICFVPDYED